MYIREQSISIDDPINVAVHMGVINTTKGWEAPP